MSAAALIVGPLSDEELVDAWRAHHALVASDRDYLDDLVKFDQFRLNLADGPRSAEQLDLILFRHSAQDYVRTLANELNEWRHRLLRLEKWAEVLDRYEETARMDLMWEFVSPLAECSLQAPYSVKQRLVFTACRVLENSTPHRGNPQAPEDKMGWSLLGTLAKGHASGQRLVSAVGQLDGASFRASTGNYRHRAVHRRPPGLDHDIHSVWERTSEADGSTTHSINVAFPLSLNAVVPPLLGEHRRAVSAFEKLWKLIREVETELAE